MLKKKELLLRSAVAIMAGMLTVTAAPITFYASSDGREITYVYTPNESGNIIRTEVDGKVYVTAVDESIKFDLQDKMAATVHEGTLSVPYVTSGAPETGVMQISVMITDKPYTEKDVSVIDFGKMQVTSLHTAENKTSGTGTYSLPETFKEGNHIYVFAECVNKEENAEGYITNYSSQPLEIEPLELIPELSISDVSSPVTGTPLDMTASGLIGENKVPVSVSWSVGDTPVTDTEEAVAVTTYTATFTVTPDEGKAFTENTTCSLLVDGKEAVFLSKSFEDGIFKGMYTFAETERGTEAKPVLTINYETETIEGFADEADYTMTVDGKEVLFPAYTTDVEPEQKITNLLPAEQTVSVEMLAKTLPNKCIGITDDMFGKTVTFVRTARNENYENSEETQLSIPERPQAPKEIVPIGETVDGEMDGALTNLSDTMEYSKIIDADKEPDTWTSVSSGETEVKRLSPGLYAVRQKAVQGEQFVGPYAEIQISGGEKRVAAVQLTMPSFEAVEYGYNRPDKKPITIRNTGNTKLLIEAAEQSNEDAFELIGQRCEVDAGKDVTWYIQPKEGLELDGGDVTVFKTDVTFTCSDYLISAEPFTKKGTVEFTVEPKSVNAIHITDIVAPIGGRTFDTTATCLEDISDEQVLTVMWSKQATPDSGESSDDDKEESSDDNSGNGDENTGTDKPAVSANEVSANTIRNDANSSSVSGNSVKRADFNATYKASISILPKEGYIFGSDSSVYVNGEKAVAEISPSGLITVTKIFKTEKERLQKLIGTSELYIPYGKLITLPSTTYVETESGLVSMPVTWEEKIEPVMQAYYTPLEYNSAELGSGILKAREAMRDTSDIEGGETADITPLGDSNTPPVSNTKMYIGTIRVPELINGEGIALTTELKVTECAPDELCRPVCLLPAGSYFTDELPIDLKCYDNTAEVYYTLDGTDPSKDNGFRYTPESVVTIPREYGETTVVELKAVACKDDTTSAISDYTYTLIGYDSLPESATVNSVTIEEGNEAEFSVQIEDADNAFEYQWYVDKNDGKGFCKIDGATNMTYTTSATTVECDGYKYKCVVITRGSIIETGVATLHVLSEAAETFTVSVTDGSGSGNYTAGETVTIQATTKAYKKFEKWLVVSGDVKLSNEKEAITTFIMPNEDVQLMAMYSDTVVPPVISTLASNMTSQTVKKGSSVTFSVLLQQGTAPFTYKWYVNKGDGTGFVQIADAAAATYTIDNVTLNMSGYKYKCIVSNEVGSTESPTAVLTVLEDAATTNEVTILNGYGSGFFAPGTKVPISASVPLGKKFVKWLVISGNVTLDNPYAQITTFTMPDSPVTIGASLVDIESSAAQEADKPYFTQTSGKVVSSSTTKTIGSSGSSTATTTDDSDSETVDGEQSAKGQFILAKGPQTGDNRQNTAVWALIATLALIVLGIFGAKVKVSSDATNDEEN